MKIVYFDPGLAGRGGHNSAMLAEFEQALVHEAGHEVTVLAAARLAPAVFGDSALRFVPLFEVEGYHTFDAATLASGRAGPPSTARSNASASCWRVPTRC